MSQFNISLRKSLRLKIFFIDDAGGTATGSSNNKQTLPFSINDYIFDYIDFEGWPGLLWWIKGFN